MRGKVAVFAHNLFHFGQIDEKVGVEAVVHREQIVLDIRKAVQYFQDFRASDNLKVSENINSQNVINKKNLYYIPCRVAGSWVAQSSPYKPCSEQK